MRRAPAQDEENMDSLLDTLMNVVGILIIVLVVTQLGVGEAVKRIGKTMQVDPVMLQKSELELLEKEKEHDRLLTLVEDLQQLDEATITKRLEELLQQKAEREEELELLESELKSKLKKTEENEQLAAEIQENKALLEKLRKEILAAQEEEARLNALLEKTRPRQEMPAIEVNLPNPRPAPPGAEQILFVCSNNKLYPLVAEPLQQESQELGLELIRRMRLDLHVPVTDSQKIFYLKEPEKFVQAFNEKSLKRQYFRVEMVAAGSSPRLVFHPLEDSGETQRTINRASSQFRKRLKAVDQSSYYIRFNVCADSFDVYVTARPIISRIGLLAGWEPMPVDWKYSMPLGGTIRFGPPPKPKPKTKTPPPAPKPTKPGPKKPVNVID